MRDMTCSVLSAAAIRAESTRSYSLCFALRVSCRTFANNHARPLCGLLRTRWPIRISESKVLLSCDQHHAEPCFAFDHASVSISSLLERKCLDHWADVLQDAEGKGVL